jgi:inhibitor of KinA sporulation pathway (predicted exonuclease)
MARRLDKIVVVDVEATCWDGAPPPGEEAEIIEIGVCLLDVGTGAREAKRSILVRPERSRVGDACTRLTTLTQEQVEGGIPFAQACAALAADYGTRERAWASYGDYDRRQFERQCASRAVRYPFGVTHLNIKHLCALALRLPREIGMDEALRRLGLPLEGTHHRAHDDAWNIAAILARLLARAQDGSTGG